MEGTSLHFKDDETLVLNKTFDRRPLEENAKQIRAANGRGSFINGLGRHVASIPVEEYNMLLAQKDPDFMEWHNDPCNSNAAWHRLLKRFPHWLVYGGGIR